MGRNFAEKKTIKENYSKKLIRGTVNATVGIDSPKRFIETYGKNHNRVELLRILEKESKFKLIWYSVFFTFIFVFAILYPQSYLRLIELAILMLAIDLASRGKIIGFYIMIGECFLYAYLSYNSGLIGEVVKNLAICLPLNIYTIVSWSISMKKSKQNSKNPKYKVQEDADVVIKKLPKKKLVFAVIISFFTAGLGYLLLRFGFKQNVSLITNSLVLGFMITYKVLGGARYMESWLFGIVQSALSLLMWCSTVLSGAATVLDLPMIAVTLAVLSNNIYGYSMWKVLYRRVAVNGGMILNKRPVSIKKIIVLRRKFKKGMIWDKKVDTLKNS